MSVAADKLKPLDYVKVHGLAEKPVVCIVTTDGNYIAISTSKPLSFLNADKRLVAQNLGALSSLIDSAPQVYQDLLVAGTKKTQLVLTHCYLHAHLTISSQITILLKLPFLRIMNLFWMSP